MKQEEIGTFSDVLFFLEQHGIPADSARELALRVFNWGVEACMDRLRPSRPAPSDAPEVDGALLSDAPKAAKPRPKPATIKRRIPDDFALTADLMTFAKDRGFAEARIRKMFEDFVNYYRASGKTWADWNAVWRQWVNRERDRINDRGGVGPQEGSFL